MSDSSLDSGLTGEAAVAIVSTQVLASLRWIYRSQPVLDYGIDGQVEIKLAEMPSGRLIALQIKGGPSWFSEENEKGWVFRPKVKHVRYWLSHVLPVIVVIVNIDTGIAYWQHVSHKTLKATKGGYKLVIPKEQTIVSARDAWLEIAKDMSSQASERFRDSLSCLPPAAVEHLERSWNVEPIGTAWLALFLAEGRTTPKLTVETLLAAQPSWLQDTGAHGWCAVGAYASEHELAQVAANAFRRAAELDSDRSGRLLAIAGLQVAEQDREQAAVLFDQAQQFPGGALLAQLGLIMLHHPVGSAHPFDVSGVLDFTTFEAQKEPAVQAFLAMQAQRERRLDESIAHFKSALNLRSESSTYMLGIADAYIKRALSDADYIDDLGHALAWATQALKQRRKWDGDSVEALVLVLRILVLQENFEEIIKQGAKDPHGEARDQEACDRKVVRTVLEAARILDATDVVDDVLDSLEDVDFKERLTLELDDELNEETQRELGEIELLEAEQLEDYEMLITSVMRLASLGLDRISHLDPLIERGIASRENGVLASALLKASSDLNGALPVLRSLADVDKVAAQNLVILLVKAGRFEEAEYACQRAYDRLRDIDLIVLRFQIAVQAGQLDTAEQIGRDLIAEPTIISVQRARICRFLAAQATRREDWPFAERHLRQSLKVIPSLVDKWNLVRVQLNQRRDRQAAETIRAYALNARDIDDAKVWFHAMLNEPWDNEVVAQGLDLAARFADDLNFAGAVITHIISNTRSVSGGQSGENEALRENDARTPIDSDLRKQAFHAMEAYADRHGAESPIRRYDFSPEKLVAHLKADLSSIDRSPVRDILTSVRRGTMPLGMLALAAGKPYALIVAERAAGILPSSSPDVDTHSLEMENALASLGRPVVVEASALHLSTLIGRLDDLRGLFADMVLPAISRDDIVQATVRARGLTGSSGFLGWDERLQKLTYYEVSASERAELWERAELLDDAAHNTRIEVVDSLALFSKFNSDVRVWPWLAPIELANRLGIALWCDDSALRRFASSVNVPSFGTAALVEALLSRRIEDASAISDEESVEKAVAEQRQFVRDLVAESAVDLPVDLEDLLAQAERDDWAATVAAMQLSRGSWWKWTEKPIDDLLALYREVAERRPDALPMWQVAAMSGAVESWRSNPVGASIVVAAVALVGFEGTLNVEAAQIGLARADELANYSGIPNPSDFIEPALNVLHKMGLVDAPARWLREIRTDD